MALPFLPGNTFSTNVGKDKYHKSHVFDCKNEVAFMFGQTRPGIGGEPLPAQVIPPAYSNYPRGEGSDLPSWVAFDRQVLSFDAYFQEAVFEKREEPYRVRNCKVYFYLEDDSIQVVEPRIKNSGIPQGTIVRRHRIPYPPPKDDQYYRIEDFNIGNELSLYSRVYKLTGADEFTMNFLGKLGVRVKGGVQMDAQFPADPYTKYRKAMEESMQPLRPYEKHDTLKQFLDHDRHVLRFYCHWDDSESMFGDSRDLVLHYFLADDTLEIREIIPANSGRDAAPLFLRRAKLPKMVDSMKQPGVVTDRTVLNVFGPTGHGGRYILDSLKSGAINQQFYSDADLKIGNFLNVWGRKMQICDADEFTKEYYRTKFGIDMFTTVESKKPSSAAVSGVRQTPPYNGFGGEEDTMCSCVSLLPKPPRRDFIKFMEKDRRGLESNVLRFLARMENPKPIDKDRRFIISYYLSDDTIIVFEPQVRNSGIIGGRFLERGRIRKPNQPLHSIEPSECYTVNDLFVGASVDFNCFKFQLIDADDYAFMYMERYFEKFPVADVNAVLRKLAPKARENTMEVRQHLANNDPDKSGLIQYEQFHKLARQLDANLQEHEIMTVARYYSDLDEDKPIEIAAAVMMVQDHLRRHNFTEFDHLKQYYLHYDQARVGKLSSEDCRRVLRAQKVSVPSNAIRALLSCIEQDGMVDYEQFVYFLNWRDYPATPVSLPIKLDDDWTGNRPQTQVQQVRYQDLMNDLVGSAPTE